MKAILKLQFLKSVYVQSIPKKPECGKTLGCFHDGCPGGECSFLLTWKDSGSNVDLSLACKRGDNAYCAIGLSSDDKMVYLH